MSIKCSTCGHVLLNHDIAGESGVQVDQEIRMSQLSRPRLWESVSCQALLMRVFVQINLVASLGIGSQVTRFIKIDGVDDLLMVVVLDSAPSEDCESESRLTPHSIHETI